MPGLIALDTETNGLDFNHGARPFLVTMCDVYYDNVWWEWDVDPLTREVDVCLSDLADIENRMNDADEIVLQHGKFDLKGLSHLEGTGAEDGAHGWMWEEWPWEKIQDTLFAAHLLNSSQAHDLTTLASVYAKLDIQFLEDIIQEHTNHARRIARTHLKDWMIAKAGLPNMPSVKSENKNKTSKGVESESPWKNDMWLPRTICRLAPELLPDTDTWNQGDNPMEHPWASSCANYANGDTAATVPVWLAQKAKLEKLGLWEIYLARMQVLPIIYSMETVGMSINQKRMDELRKEYIEEIEKANATCLYIAESYGFELEMPRGPNNKSLTSFCFDEDKLNLPIIRMGKKQPAFDKKIIDIYEDTLPQKSKQLAFVKNLKMKRKRGKSVEYMDGWERFAIHIEGDYYRLFPSVNPTGTATLRSASYNPSEQVISKQKDLQGKNLRYAFGPVPGRAWAALDYENLELRIPAYECEEPAMLELFENPDSPPYYGKYHLLIFDILHPELFAKHGKEVTNLYADTWYQWTKNGNFAEMYGAIDREDGMGTADIAFHVPGAQSKISSKLVKKSALNQQWIAYANKHGYVETLPDKGLGHKRGYPLYCGRTSWGKISPTVPLNYHVQGTACWIKMRAMIKCQEYLTFLKTRYNEDWYIIADIHDELLFDFPASSNYKPKLRKLKQLMESCGDDVGIKLKVGCDIHLEHWCDGVAL